jgi:hypothetical protein
MNLKNAPFMRTMENVDAGGTSILENLKDYEHEAWLLGFRLRACSAWA